MSCSYVGHNIVSVLVVGSFRSCSLFLLDSLLVFGIGPRSLRFEFASCFSVLVFARFAPSFFSFWLAVDGGTFKHDC